jgi:N-acetyl-alpha-D-glucosaminyl L-malate synthase BshA
MESRPLKLGITCFPLIGGSGILATALGTELAARGHTVHFFSYAKPVRLDLSAPRIHFHQVAVGQSSLFPCPDYTLPLAVKMAQIAREVGLDIFHVHYAVPHATAAYLAVQMLGTSAAPVPKIVTTLHGTDTTLLGPNPQYRAAIEHALLHSDAVTTVSESLRQQTEATFQLRDQIQVIPNFFTPVMPKKSRAEVRHELGISDEFLVMHMSNLRPVKRIDLLLRVIAKTSNRDRIRLLLLAGGPFAPYDSLLDELGLRGHVIVREDAAAVENYLPALSPIPIRLKR